MRLSFDRPGSDVSAENVSRNSRWLSGVPPVNKQISTSHNPRPAQAKSNRRCSSAVERRCHEPRINKFFSGKRFPLATLSNMDDQIFFLGPSLLDGRLFDRVPNVDMIRSVRSQRFNPRRPFQYSNKSPKDTRLRRRVDLKSEVRGKLIGCRSGSFKSGESLESGILAVQVNWNISQALGRKNPVAVLKSFLVTEHQKNVVNVGCVSRSLFGQHGGWIVWRVSLVNKRT